MKKSKTRKQKNTKFIFYILYFFTFFSIVGIFNFLFTIKQTQCFIQKDFKQIPCPACDIGFKYIFLTKDVYSNFYVYQGKIIKKTKIKSIFPNKIQVFFEFYTPDLLVKYENENFFRLYVNNKQFFKLQNLNLVYLKLKSNIDEKVIELYFDNFKKIYNYFYNTNASIFIDSFLDVYVNLDNKKIYLNIFDEKLEKKLKSLEKIQKTNYKTIDLRFKTPKFYN